MRGKTINIHDAKTHLARIIARGERGARIAIVRTGKAVAELRPVRETKKRSIPPDDPLLRVNEYSYDGQIGPMNNRDIDSTVYGI